MYVDGENPTPETLAAAAETSPAPAAEPVVETASTTAPEPGPYPTYPDHCHDVAQIDALEPRVIAIAEQLIGGDKFMVEIEAAVARELDARIDNLKADILAHLTPMIEAITAAAPPAAPGPSPSVKLIAKEPGDPVKVWKDTEHKTFLEGEIVAVHDGAHAFDVKLPDGSVTKIAADGLEYDDRR